jgi:hypothetical protein
LLELYNISPVHNATGWISRVAAPRFPEYYRGWLLNMLCKGKISFLRVSRISYEDQASTCKATYNILASYFKDLGSEYLLADLSS